MYSVQLQWGLIVMSSGAIQFIGSQVLLHEGPRGALAEEAMTRTLGKQEMCPAPSEMGSERTAPALRQDLLKLAEIPVAAQERDNSSTGSRVEEWARMQ